MQRRNAGCPSDLRLDQWLAGERAAEPAELERHLESCEACQRRVAGLRAAQQSFASEAPSFSALSASEPPRSRVEAPLAPARRSARWRAALPPLLAAAALALAIGQPWQRGADGDGTRTKGPLGSASWVVRREGRVFAGEPGQPLRAGDALQFKLSAREAVYVALLGLDAAGHASVYHPDAAEMAPLPAGNAAALEVAIQLDEAPGHERFFAVFCPGAAPLASLRDAVERAPEAPALPEGCALERVTLQKELQ